MVRPQSQTVGQDYPDFIIIPTGNSEFPCKFELQSVSPLRHSLDATAQRIDFRLDLLTDNRRLGWQARPCTHKRSSVPHPFCLDSRMPRRHGCFGEQNIRCGQDGRLIFVLSFLRVGFAAAETGRIPFIPVAVISYDVRIGAHRP